MSVPTILQGDNRINLHIIIPICILYPLIFVAFVHWSHSQISRPSGSLDTMELFATSTPRNNDGLNYSLVPTQTAARFKQISNCLVPL